MATENLLVGMVEPVNGKMITILQIVTQQGQMLATFRYFGWKLRTTQIARPTELIIIIVNMLSLQLARHHVCLD